MTRTALVASLTPLFASLLSGCFTSSSCDDFKGGSHPETITLTASEYAAWAAGSQPAPTSGPASSTGESTTGDPTTGDPTTGEPLTPQQVCEAVCNNSFGSDVASCSTGQPDPSGTVEIQCEINNVCEGRSHACILSRGHTDASAATWLARAAHDEAASVHAFEALAAELTTHHAPASLLARIHAAAADETRHATTIHRLAHEHDASPIPVTLTPTPPRTLLAIALENAREGCVHETWAALSAAHQARHAATPRLRNIYKTIAADEARHAELAWSLDTWLSGQLTANQRTLVEAARTAAATNLRTRLATQPFGPALAALGLPSPATATRLAADLTTTLWSQAA